ncbi:MAG: prolyl oligopeptidase family serine peptidase [Candidatus Aminicenantes bacterium]|nr:prolyl oligopeptidase family serine peptidase [Candidatus Aminicenantes bacterium]
MKKNTGFWTFLTYFCFLLISYLSLIAGEKKPLTFVDAINIKSIYNLRLSPDSNQALFTQSEADWKGNRSLSHIWRMNTDGTKVVQMTNGKDGEGGGIWSPDGEYISFITKRESKEAQVFLLANSGGEAIPLTDHKTRIRSHRWSPCSQKIYFLAEDPLTKEEEKKKKDKDDALIFEQDFKPAHLWVFDLKTKEEKRLTEGDFTIRQFSVSRDGTKMLFAAAPTPLYDDILNSEIWVMDLKDSSRRQITQNGIFESDISLSPDNNQILFVADADPNLKDYYYQSNFFTVPAEGGTPKALLPDFPYEVYDTEWSADGKSIYFTANMGVHSEIFSLRLKDLKLKQLTDGNHAIYGFDYNPKTDTLLYEVSSPQNPDTFWMMDQKSRAARMIHDPHPELKDFKLAEYEAVRWKSTDGKEVEGILIYPVDFEKGKRYPLLAHTHGGPMGSDKFTFDGYAHARAGRGYAVFKPNYRGSTGYGNEVLRDMVGHYFLHADDDVLTGVEYLVQKGIADPEKLGTLGWSAGGHMTNWLVTQTDKFKAASSGAGASNWISMYAQSDVRIYRTPWFLGNPWHEDSPLQTFREHSPIFYVHQAKTPTLILCGENDRRVPLPQSVEMYRGLKANGVPTELVIFPRSGHGPRELRHRLYRYNKEFQWLEKYIMNRDFEFEKPPTVDDKDDKDKPE